MILYYPTKFNSTIINSFRVMGREHFPPPPPPPSRDTLKKPRWNRVKIYHHLLCNVYNPWIYRSIMRSCFQIQAVNMECFYQTTWASFSLVSLLAQHASGVWISIARSIDALEELENLRKGSVLILHLPSHRLVLSERSICVDSSSLLQVFTNVPFYGAENVLQEENCD